MERIRGEELGWVSEHEARQVGELGTKARGTEGLGLVTYRERWSHCHQLPAWYAHPSSRPVARMEIRTLGWGCGS